MPSATNSHSCLFASQRYRRLTKSPSLVSKLSIQLSEVGQIAYRLWEEAGFPYGRYLEFWDKATTMWEGRKAKYYPDSTICSLARMQAHTHWADPVPYSLHYCWSLEERPSLLVYAWNLFLSHTLSRLLNIKA